MEALFILDASVFLMLTVLANLSRRIGEALQIGSHYRLLYSGAALLLIVMVADILAELYTWETAKYITISLRAFVATMAIPICFRYWYWLFNENLSRK